VILRHESGNRKASDSVPETMHAIPHSFVEFHVSSQFLLVFVYLCSFWQFNFNTWSVLKVKRLFLH